MKTLELFGRGSISKLNKSLTKLRGSRVLLITGKNSYEKSPKRLEVESNLDGFLVQRYCDVDLNPDIENLINGVRFANQFNPDIIVGLGGGSVLDTAKLISILPANESEIRDIIIGIKRVPARIKHLILAPTTSGSGSEATQFAVSYVGKKKYSVSSLEMLPDMVFLDSEFTDTMPKELTATTAFDAISQAIESFWAVGATRQSMNYASTSISAILEIFYTLLTNPTSECRDQMMISSNLAGKAINISKTTGPHAISYALTKYFRIPHGIAVILTLAAFFEFNTNMINSIPNKPIEIAEYEQRIARLYQIMRAENSAEVIIKINKMIKQAGLKPGLKNFGLINPEDLILLTESVNIERLNNNPLSIDKSQLMTILKKSW